jgi:hypothetical protein
VKGALVLCQMFIFPFPHSKTCNIYWNVQLFHHILFNPTSTPQGRRGSD